MTRQVRPTRRLGLDLDSIRLVLAIAEHRSLRRAAAALAMSESALSHRLRSLEEALTVALFHRSSEGVQPTNAGIAFFASAREALRVLDLATANAQAASVGVTGRFHLGLYTSLSTGRLRHALNECRLQHPEIELQIVEGGRSRMIEGLRSRAIDLAVMIGRPDANIGEAMPLWRERAFAIVRSDHPLAVEPDIGWDRIAGETLLFSTRDAGPEAEVALTSRSDNGARWPNRRLHTVSRETLYALVSLGYGIALMIESDLGYRPPDVVAVPLSEQGKPSLELLTAYRDPGNDNPPLRRFWSLLKSRYSERN